MIRSITDFIYIKYCQLYNSMLSKKHLAFLVLQVFLINAYVVPITYGQNDTALFSIKQCIEYAAENNSNIKVARYDEMIGISRVKEIKGWALPQANINGNFEDRLKVPLLVIPGGFPSGSTGGSAETRGIRMGYQYNSSLTGEVTQMIFDPSFSVGLKAAKQSNLLYQQNTVQVNEQTAYNIANAYYQVIVLDEQLKLLKTNLSSTLTTLAVTELQLKNGVAKQVDVKRLKVNASNLESQIKQSELNKEQAFNNLKFQMGMPVDKTIVLSDTVLTLNDTETALSSKVENFEENRIEYKITKTNLELQRLDIKNNVKGYFPTLTAYANYGYQGQGAEIGLFKTANNDWVDYTTSSIGLRLRVPVFDGLQRSAKIQQSRLKTQQLEENLKLTSQNIRLEVSNADMQYKNTLKRIQAEKENVDLAQEVYEITQLEFREGVSTSTDLVEAETSLRRAQNTYAQTLLDLYTARLNLEKAKGNLLNYINSK